MAHGFADEPLPAARLVRKLAVVCFSLAIWITALARTGTDVGLNHPQEIRFIHSTH
jgi:hypothetical protein